MVNGKEAAYRKRRVDHRASAAPSAGRAFWSGVAKGLGALTLLGSDDFDPPRYGGDGVRGSWRVVGDQLRTVMRREQHGRKG